MGATVGAVTAKEHQCVYVVTLRHHLDRAMALLADIVRRPMYDPADFDAQVINAEVCAWLYV